jgi:cysteine desulfurase
MEPYWSEVFGNASSPYAVSRQARMALDEARTHVARLIGAHSDEIVWTSGGTESDNWALLGVALAHLPQKGHFVISAIEHHAVLEAASTLRELGFSVDFAEPNRQGVVEAESIEALLRADTHLVSLMSANNETGVLQPLPRVAALCRQRGVPLHVDATQSAGKMPLDVDFGEGGADLMTISAHKLGGPKGVGALYIRRGTRMRPLQRGGAQERGRRAGTENVPAIVGFGVAAQAARQELEEHFAALPALRERLEERLIKSEKVALVGAGAERAPHISSFIVQGVRAESLALQLDLLGFAVGTGSACASGALEPSHVLAAMGYSADEARSALRVSFGRQNTREEVDEFIKVLERWL